MYTYQLLTKLTLELENKTQKKSILELYISI